MNVRLILAVFLAIGGMGVLLAHPAFYSRSWAFGLLVVFVGCGVVAAFWCAVHRDWPLSGAVSVALAVVGMSTLLSIAVNEGTKWSGLWLPVTHWPVVYCCPGLLIVLKIFTHHREIIQEAVAP